MRAIHGSLLSSINEIVPVDLARILVYAGSRQELLGLTSTLKSAASLYAAMQRILLTSTHDSVSKFNAFCL